MAKYETCKVCGATNPTVCTRPDPIFKAVHQATEMTLMCDSCAEGKPLPNFVKMKGSSAGAGKGKHGK
jgi:hypothetical protein